MSSEEEKKKRKDLINEEINEFNQGKKGINCDGYYSESDSTLNVTMEGPNDSPYIGGKFKISVTFPEKFPSEKPIFKFITPICHINISPERICLDSITYYDSSYTILQILTQIFIMLTSPNEDSILNSTYGDIYKRDLDEYFAKAREMTRQYAM
jgi:ubiquitin-protein ligase